VEGDHGWAVALNGEKFKAALGSVTQLLVGNGHARGEAVKVSDIFSKYASRSNEIDPDSSTFPF
jgi:hypothetical protein